MKWAIVLNGEINLVEEKEVVKLASWDEVIDSICLGEIEVGEFTRIQEGILVWNEEECEMDLVRI